MEPSLDLDNLENSLRSHLYSRYGMHSDFDDGIQEALVRCWTDMQNGITDRNFILNRAKIWFKAKVYGDAEDTHRWTGEPSRSREGYRRDTAAREKVEQQYHQHYELHREYPTAAEISRATGLSNQKVAYHLKRVHRYSSYLGNRKDYMHHSLDSTEGEEIQGRVRVESFEDEWISYDNFTRLVAQLTEQEQSVFTLRYVYGMSNTEIGKILWPEVASSASRERANKAAKRGLKKLKEYVG